MNNFFQLKRKKRKLLSEKAAMIILGATNKELRKLKLCDLARTVDTKSSFLARTFKQDQKLNFEQFKVRETIYRAIHAMERNQGIDVDALARELDYPETGEFVTLFKNNMLVHPAKYWAYIKLRTQ